jgi:uncharacterized membrane protein
MAEDQSSPDKSKQLDDRLSYLEMVARDTAARLYEIEKHLGLVFHAVPRDLETHPEIKREDQRSESAPGIEDAAKPEGSVTEILGGDSVSPHIWASEPIGLDRLPEQSGPELVSAPPAAVDSQESETTALPTALRESFEPEPVVLPVPPTAVAFQESEAMAPPTAVHPITPATRAEQMQQTQTHRSVEASEESPDLESRIGGRWLLWIGIIAISFGVAFFLKYAFDNQWITPGWRINIGIAIGLGFLIGAERLRGRYPIYASGLTGGGIFILYLSIFVGFNTYALIPRALALALMAAVTATASLLAARYSALSIAILGLIGGFLTPILLSTGVDNEAGLFGYIALLDLGVLALAYSKHWRSLNFIAYGATVAMFAGWWLRWYAPEKLWPTILFLTLFFMIFALLAVLHNVINRRPTRWLDLGMVFSNAILYFSTSYELLDDKYHSILGLFAVLVSAFYMGLGYFTYSRDREDRLLIFTFLGLAFLFAVLAVPIQLDQHWVTMCWALEGAAMTWIGLRVEDRTSRYASLLVFGVALGHWFNTDVREFAYHANENFLPLLNRRALSCAMLVGALAATAVFYKRMKSNVEDSERSMFSGLYMLAANTLAVILLSIDAIDYFEQAKASASGRDYLSSVGNSKALTLTALWAIYGAGTLFVGVTRRLRPLRYLALILLGGATVKVLLVDLRYYDESWHALILNQTFLALASIVAALALSARFYARGMEPDDEERNTMLPLLIGAANLLAVVALAAEALGHFDRAQAIASGETTARLENAKQLALSAVWTIYGATALTIGIRRRSQAVRIGSLILLAAATFKAFGVDLAYYNAGWHMLLVNPTFASFALLIIAMAAGAWFYSRSEDIGDKERTTVIPMLVGAVNVLALVALSAEALGYFDRAQAIATGDAIAPLENTKQLALSMVWTIYGATALIIGIRRRLEDVRTGALLLLGLAAVKVVAIDLRYYKADWHTLMINPTFAAFALLMIALVAGAWFYSHADDIGERERAAIIPALVGAASLLAIIALSAEAIGYFDRAQAHAQLATEVARLGNNEQFVLSALWTIFGAALLIGGIKRGLKPFRAAGLLLLAVVILKMAVADVNYYRAPWHALIFNETFGAFALLILALSLSVWFYSRAENLDEERSLIAPYIVGVVNVLAVVALSAEVLGYFGKNLRAGGISEDQIRTLHLARQLWLSLVWAIYGGAMLTVGIARRSKLLRVMALLLLGLTIFKVFLFDLSSLEKLYRIISFIVLGAILLAVSFLYQRYRQRMAEFIGEPNTEEPVSSASN